MMQILRVNCNHDIPISSLSRFGAVLVLMPRLWGILPAHEGGCHPYISAIPLKSAQNQLSLIPFIGLIDFHSAVLDVSTYQEQRADNNGLLLHPRIPLGGGGCGDAHCRAQPKSSVVAAASDSLHPGCH